MNRLLENPGTDAVAVIAPAAGTGPVGEPVEADIGVERRADRAFVVVSTDEDQSMEPLGAELQAAGKDVMAEMFEKDVAGFTEERIEGAEPGEILPEPAEASEGTEASDSSDPSETPTETSDAAETNEEESADQA